MFYNDEGDESGDSVHRAGLRVWERPSRSLHEVMAERRRISAIADDAERDAAIYAFLADLGSPDPFGSQL